MRPLFMLLAALWLAASSPYIRAQGTCGPSPVGEPCSGGGLAVAASPEPGLNLGVGNPIHVVTGNKYQKETDLPANAWSFGLEVVRHYNALDPSATVLGRGWRFSYDTRLFKVGGRWQIVQADGSRVAFTSTGTALVPGQGQLSIAKPPHVWTWASGHSLAFNANGYLIGIITPSKNQLHILREAADHLPPGTITRVINAQGHALLFHYQTLGKQVVISHIDTPLGRYDYRFADAGSVLDEPPQLSEVTRPHGMRKRYLYEAQHQAGNHHALTGIELVSSSGAQALRTNTWTYDTQGRAVSSVQGKPDSLNGRVELNYVRSPSSTQAGVTIVKNAAGEESHYNSRLVNGRYLLDSVSGASCSGCATPGVQAQYDAQARLTQVNGTKLLRDAKGQLLRLDVADKGWPALSFQFDSRGQRSAWSASLTGTEQLRYDANRRPTARVFANGDSLVYQYDAQGRPVSMQESSARASLHTDLAWHGSLLTRIRHPHETESRRYDDARRLVHRDIQRPAHGIHPALNYTESFEYDKQNRLVLHRLPEGGALAYSWTRNGRLTSIHWHDGQGVVNPVVDTVAGRPGYRYGNGLHLETSLNAQNQADSLVLYHDKQLVWSLERDYDDSAKLQQESQHFPDQQKTHAWRYAYDDDGRLVGAQVLDGTERHGSAQWYAWNADGSAAAKKHEGRTLSPNITRDASGLPLTLEASQLVYGPARRLTEVHRNGAQIASYRHNAFGYRIFSAGPDQHTHFFYLNNQLVAQAQGGTSVTRRYIYAHHVLVGFIDYPTRPAKESDRTSTFAPRAPLAQLYAVHSDLIGAPVMVTDSHRKLRWLARYDPMGTAVRIAGDLSLDLRLPGQVYDALTGWHDNLLRTYLPQWGQYLEPDPLGPIPGQQALGYARQQPRRYIDPLGLLLFAFDGTRNSPQTASNVWKLSQYYQDGPVFYQSGPGNPMYIDWDAIAAGQASNIIDAHWQSLLNELNYRGSRKDSIPIDIIGFSRGAALARHFGNLINQYVDGALFSYQDPTRGLITACVDLRFMGLFDTVAQFGLAGSQNSNYDLSIASAWEWVAHAVALNEHRMLFPLTAAADTGAHNVVEAPFIGAHADIGGGVALSDQALTKPSGDLPDVALNWMLWQARAAGLRFGDTANSDRILTNPVLHDERAPLLRSIQNGDRSVDQASGVLLHYYQDDHARLGREQRASAEAAILRNPNWRRQAGSEVGMVDMSGYARWLHDELGWQAMPV